MPQTFSIVKFFSEIISLSLTLLDISVKFSKKAATSLYRRRLRRRADGFSQSRKMLAATQRNQYTRQGSIRQRLGMRFRWWRIIRKSVFTIYSVWSTRSIPGIYCFVKIFLFFFGFSTKWQPVHEYQYPPLNGYVDVYS